jgi:hypothetical protein
MSGFDEKCPYCETEIDVRSEWEYRDYADEFFVDCKNCNHRVQVDVVPEPIFETSKPMCKLCCRAEATVNPHYCDPCHAKLKELSKHNGGGP